MIAFASYSIRGYILRRSVNGLSFSTLRFSMGYTTKEVKPALWPEIKKLFGSNGACGGCWCQAWRTEKGESWSDIKGSVARERLRSGIRNGTTQGILAFDAGVPIGWCTFGPRNTFPRLNRATTLGCNDSSLVWSVPCFFVSRRYREKGVATLMLNHAILIMKRNEVQIAEAYPSKPDKEGRTISAFSWTGTRSLFKKAGFTLAGNPSGSKQRVRKNLAR
jgi:GNAT superfamily N-acetyltransferase